MTRTKPATEATAPAVPSIHFTTTNPRERLARLVLDSPRLLAVVPADELAPLFAAYNGATKAADAARALRVTGADLRAELDAALRAGDEVDAAALMARIGDAQAAEDNRTRTVALLGSLPRDYVNAIVSVIDAFADDYWDALSADLSALLDRAAVVVAELDGVTDAESAIDAGKAAEWAALRVLLREYGDLRRLHLALLNLEPDVIPYGAGSPRLARIYWAGLEDVAEVTTPTADALGRPVAPPLAFLLDVDSLDHLRAAVLQRATLRPHVGRPDGTSATESETVVRDTAVPASFDPRTGDLVRA